jgi:hypothetical protein
MFGGDKEAGSASSSITMTQQKTKVVDFFFIVEKKKKSKIRLFRTCFLACYFSSLFIHFLVIIEIRCQFLADVLFLIIQL